MEPGAVDVLLDGAQVVVLLAVEILRAPPVRLDEVAQVALAARHLVPITREVACAPVHAALALAQVALAPLQFGLRERLLGSSFLVALLALVIALHLRNIQ